MEITLNTLKKAVKKKNNKLPRVRGILSDLSKEIDKIKKQYRSTQELFSAVYRDTLVKPDWLSAHIDSREIIFRDKRSNEPWPECFYLKPEHIKCWFEHRKTNSMEVVKY